MDNVIDLLYKVHGELAKYYLKKLKAGDFSPQDAKNLIQFLKDNGISTEARRGTPLAQLLELDFSILDEIEVLN